MFDLPYRRWLDFVIHLPVVGSGAALAYALPVPPFPFIGALISTSGFLMIAVNQWGCAVNKTHDDLPTNELSTEAMLRMVGREAYEAKQPKETHPGDAWKATKVMGLALNQTLAPVKIDYEREFCKTLVSMKEVSGKMDISETYWLKGGHWEKINPQLTPTEFKQMRNKFEACHIFGKKGTADNSPYIVLNEQAVEMRASGKLRKLPTPPGL